jgi:predicted AlkP superfamily pyrophosphatase or phosphodiesterase
MKQALLALILFSRTRLNAAPVAAAQSRQVKKTKLLLAIAIEQFRYDYTERFRDQYTGGLARLLTEGAIYIDAHQNHFPTVTPPASPLCFQVLFLSFAHRC